VVDVASVDEDTLMEAAESCPTSAIVVEEDDGRQVYP
jgi:ferredoxin